MATNASRTPAGSQNGNGHSLHDPALTTDPYDESYRIGAGEEPVADSRSPGTLLRQLAGDAGTLLRKELALAAAEITRSIEEAKTGATSMVTGGAVLYAGVLFLLGAATLGLALVVPAWTAALIVGGVTTLIGFIMVQSGKKRMEARSFKPERAMDSLRKDTDAIRRQVQ